jgi:hypothetical protein
MIRFTTTLAAPVCFWISRPKSVSASFPGGWLSHSRVRSNSTASRICFRPFSGKSSPASSHPAVAKALSRSRRPWFWRARWRNRHLVIDKNSSPRTETSNLTGCSPGGVYTVITNFRERYGVGFVALTPQNSFRYCGVSRRTFSESRLIRPREAVVSRVAATCDSGEYCLRSWQCDAARFEVLYLDIEGIPDHDSYYLVGILILSEGH